MVMSVSSIKDTSGWFVKTLNLSQGGQLVRMFTTAILGWYHFTGLVEVDGTICGICHQPIPQPFVPKCAANPTGMMLICSTTILDHISIMEKYQHIW